MPVVWKVEVAFDAGPATASPTWTDVSADVSLAAGITFNRGRGQTSTTPEPGRLQLTLNNDSGDYTWGKVGNASTLGRGDTPPLRQPIRVTALTSDYDSESMLYDDAFDYDGYESMVVWTGFVDEWSQEWDNGWRPRVRVTASDRLAKLALLNLDDGAIMSEVLSDGPVAYYPLDEPAGAVSFGDRSGNELSPLTSFSVGAGAGTIDAGAGVAPDGEGTVVALTQTSATNGLGLEAISSAPFLVGGSDVTVDAWVRFETFYLDTTQVVRLGDASGAFAVLVLNDLGEFRAGWGTYSTAASASIADGEWHHIALVGESGSATTYLDGALLNVDSTGTAPTRDGDRVSIGRNSSPYDSYLFDGQIAHVAVYDSALSAARIEAHYDAGKAAGSFYGDTASERFERLCRLGALPSGSYLTDAAATTVLDRQPLGGIGLLEAIQQVTDSERGVVYVDGAGVLTYLGDATLTAQPVALVLDNDDIEGDLSVYVNDQTVVNDVTVTRPTGATQRRADTVSQSTMGVTNAVTVDTLLTTDAAAGALADRLLSEGTAVQPVTGDLTVDLMTRASTVDAATLLALDTGARVQVTGLPASAPVDTLDLRVEGVAASISEREAKIRLTCSPALTVAPWELDDATYSVLDQTTKLAWP